VEQELKKLQGKFSDFHTIRSIQEGSFENVFQSIQNRSFQSIENYIDAVAENKEEIDNCFSDKQNHQPLKQLVNESWEKRTPEMVRLENVKLQKVIIQMKLQM
jgi:hypothetical protein